ncbi:MAG: adenine-specific DNA methylase [Candidatus Accumulibacter regalis]|jgi:Protein of unknown function (DUF1156).
MPLLPLEQTPPPATSAAGAALQPFALKDAPALIEAVFPAQKISFEAQRERKAGAGQTLTALGSYWKGRKPLILVRAILLGSLLPQTDDPEKDLEVFEKLMAFDEGSLARRALDKNAFKPIQIAKTLELQDPWKYFTYKIEAMGLSPGEVNHWLFPLDPENNGIAIRWRKTATDEMKLRLYGRMLETLGTYEERAGLCKRPEEMDQTTLYAPIWPTVNTHLGHLGVAAYSHQELIEQLGMLRYGHRPRVGDTFCGGGSIPFEAARLGCDVYASDLNPIACMLTWGAFNIIGASPEKRTEIERAQREVAEALDREITDLRIEHDSHGNRAKAYLYCLETRCPETGWMIPMSWTWVISRTWNVIARLIPDHRSKRFEIEVVAGVTAAEIEAADVGTVRDGNLVYDLDGKTYRTPVKTLRGDYKNSDANTANHLRLWDKRDFIPHPDDIFHERLYCIQWITKESLGSSRKETFFSAVINEDFEREEIVESIVARNIATWQEEGYIPEMEIEVGGPPRYQGRDLIIARGWSCWHHLFNPRQLLQFALIKKIGVAKGNLLALGFSSALSWNSRLCSWDSSDKGREGPKNVFTNQALNTIYNYGCRSSYSLHRFAFPDYPESEVPRISSNVKSIPSWDLETVCTNWITDPPYADAVMYHEITEFFIAWLRKNPPPPFNEWTWDSRRDLAIKGSGDDFRSAMVGAYKAMTEHMPDNGMQCVMFTHQDTGVWSDMVSIFWASGLQVVGAWYIATETTSELKKGGYVQGTVILMLRKRSTGDRPGFKQRILPEVKREVAAQIKQMLHLNTETEAKMGSPVFNDSDLQMAGYAAALKVLTGYTSIGGEDVTAFALRPRRKGETTVVDEIVEQAAETANGLLVPDGLDGETWQAIGGMQRFYLRMLDMETTGASKLDNYQNFAKAFRVQDYAAVMANIKPNAARLKAITEFKPRDLTDRTEIGPTPLGALIIAIQEFLADKEPEVVMANLRDALVDYLHLRPVLMDMTDFIAAKARDPGIRRAAEAVASRIRNQRLQ